MIRGERAKSKREQCKSKKSKLQQAFPLSYFDVTTSLFSYFIV